MIGSLFFAYTDAEAAPCISSVQHHHDVRISRRVVVDGAVEPSVCTDGLRTVQRRKTGEGGIYVAADGGVEGSLPAVF